MKRLYCFKNLRGDRRGFSLVELLIAIVILALIVTPLVNMFIFSGKLQLKSHQKGKQTLCAQGVMETVQSMKSDDLFMKEIMKHKNSDISTGTATKFNSTLKNAFSSGDTSFTSDGKGKLVLNIPDIKEGSQAFDAEVTLDPNGSDLKDGSSKINDKYLTAKTNFQNVINMEAVDKDYDKLPEEVIVNNGGTITKRARVIVLDFTVNDLDSTTKLPKTFTPKLHIYYSFEYKQGSDLYVVDSVKRQQIVYKDGDKSQATVTDLNENDLETNYLVANLSSKQIDYDPNDPFYLYVLFPPYYNGTPGLGTYPRMKKNDTDPGTTAKRPAVNDLLIVDNSQNMKGTVTFVKQRTDKDDKTQKLKELGYSADIFLYEKKTSGTTVTSSDYNMSINTNINRDLTQKSSDSSSLLHGTFQVMKYDQYNTYFSEDMSKSSIVRTVDSDRIFDVTVKIYKKNADKSTAKPLYTLNGMRLY
jgi:prepilin-type N-terminal cleavage/methylation domain-containing protein